MKQANLREGNRKGTADAGLGRIAVQIGHRKQRHSAELIGLGQYRALAAREQIARSCP